MRDAIGSHPVGVMSRKAIRPKFSGSPMNKFVASGVLFALACLVMLLPLGVAACPAAIGCQTCTAPSTCNQCTRTRTWSCEACGEALGARVCTPSICTATEVSSCDPCISNFADPAYVVCSTALVACEAANFASARCGDLVNTAEQLGREFTSARDSLANLGKQLDAKRRELVDLEAGLGDLNRQLQNGPNLVATAIRPFDDVIKLLKRLAAQDVVLYDASTPVEIGYNAKLGMSWYKATLPAGLKVNSAVVKSAISGNPTPPNVDPLGLALSSGLIDAKASDKYDEFARTTKGRNASTYVSSRRLVDNLSLENAASDVVLAVFSGGSTLKTAAEERADLLMMEWADILAWLDGVGASESEKMAANVISALASRAAGGGGELKWPKVEAGTGSTPYAYQVKPKVPREIVSALKLMGIDAPERLSAQASVPHFTFQIKVKGSTTPSTKQALEQFKNAMASGPTIDAGKAMTSSGLALPFDAATLGKFMETDPVNLRSIIGQAMGSEIDKIEQYHVGGLVFDLTRAPMTKELEKRLAALAIGNNGSVTIRSFALDATSLAISLKADLKHRHSLGTLAGLTKDLGQKADGLRKTIEQSLGEVKQRAAAMQDRRNQLNASITDTAARLIPGANDRVTSLRQQAKPICDALTVFGEKPLVCTL